MLKIDEDDINLLTTDKIFDQLQLMNEAINELKSFKHEVTNSNFKHYYYYSTIKNR